MDKEQVEFFKKRRDYLESVGEMAAHYVAIPAHAPFELRWASQGAADSEHPATDLDCVIKEQGPCRVIVVFD